MSETNQSQSQNSSAKKKPWYKRWWVIALGIVFILIVIGNSGEDKTEKQATDEQSQPETQEADSGAPTESADQQAEPEPTAPDLMATGADLYQAYSENEVAADEKYKGKIIELSGKVTGVDNGITDSAMIVKLSDGQYDISGPWCYMEESEKAQVLEFKKGQAVVLIGKGDGATLGSPILRHCTVK